jgi:hypothetical protein
VWKLGIILIWLSVPLGAWLMLREDTARYQIEAAKQRENCVSRAKITSRYSSYIVQLAGQIDQWETDEQRFAWQRRFNALQDELRTEQSSVDLKPPSHFPETGKLLNEAEESLARQIDELDNTQRLRFDYLRTMDAYGQLLNDRLELRRSSSYFRYMNEEQIYLELLNRLAVCEAAIDTRKQQYEILGRKVTQGRMQIEDQARRIESQLQALQDKLDAETKRTYRQDLAERLARFNLRKSIERALAQLLGGSTAPPAAKA